MEVCYSRCCGWVFLSDNILELFYKQPGQHCISFVSAVSVFGLPKKVRTDGGEKVDVWQYMSQQRGDATCVIVGSSARINTALSEFVSSWHNHPLSTERNMTPFQLFHVGHEETSHLEDSTDESEDEEGVLPAVVDHVQLPNLHFNPCSNLKSQLQQIIQQNRQCDYSLYRQVTTLVGHLSTTCSNCNYESNVYS